MRSPNSSSTTRASASLAATAPTPISSRTECVAGVQDLRFQELMPDVIHWLGIRHIDRWVSMSNLKRAALEAQGIAVLDQVAIPDRLVPLDASVEIEAKKAAGYFAPSGMPDAEELHSVKGRALGE